MVLSFTPPCVSPQRKGQQIMFASSLTCSMYIYAHAHFVYTIAEAFNDIAPGIPHQTKPTA